MCNLGVEFEWGVNEKLYKKLARSCSQLKYVLTRYQKIASFLYNEFFFIVFLL